MRYRAQQTPFGFSLTPWVKRLLIANTVIFFLSALIGPSFVNDWFAFQPGRFFTRPWGVVTYMFLHGGFWHLLMNMLILFFFGPPLEAHWGSSEFLKFYLICGIGGAALGFLFMPPAVIGASAAIYGLMLAFAMTWPEAPIYIWGILPVKAKWLAAFLFIATIFSTFGEAGGGVAHFAHLGGLLAAFVYLRGDWKTTARLERLKEVTRQRRFAIVPRDQPDEQAEDRSAPLSSADEHLLDEVDRILDKISEEGMSSLTRDELKTLDEVSRQSRTN